MQIHKVKRFLCAYCIKNEIVERITEETLEDGVPDQCNCDFSKYSDHKVVGGRLFVNRKAISWESQLCSKPATVHGGMCDDCLKMDAIKALLPNLVFAPTLLQ